MRSDDERDSPASPAPEDDRPGVPFFRTWRGVYWFVAASFVVFVIALTLFTRAFA